MGIEARTSDNEINAYVDNWVNNVIESLKEAWMLACLATVNRAKSNDTYKDRTNNLRSSIGYVLYYNGQMVADMFSTGGSGSEGNGESGVSKGITLANRVASKYSKGFVAVIVAGMEYAIYVEAGGYRTSKMGTFGKGFNVPGYDVLSGAVLRFPEELQKYYDIINKEHGTTFKA